MKYVYTCYSTQIGHPYYKVPSVVSSMKAAKARIANVMEVNKAFNIEYLKDTKDAVEVTYDTVCYKDWDCKIVDKTVRCIERVDKVELNIF